jgi:hypothetical protein
LQGRLDGGSAQYRVIEVGNPGQPYDGGLDLSFRCGGTEIHLDQIPLNEIRAMASSVEKADSNLWSAGAESIGFCDGVPSMSIWLIVFEERIMQLNGRLFDSGKADVQFKTGRSSSWISTPITDGDAIELFGTPDRTNDFFMH